MKVTKSIRTIWFYSTFKNTWLVSQVFVTDFDHQIHCEHPWNNFFIETTSWLACSTCLLFNEKEPWRKRQINLPSVLKMLRNYSNVIPPSWIYPLDLSYYIQYITLWSSRKSFSLVATINCEIHINFNK